MARVQGAEGVELSPAVSHIGLRRQLGAPPTEEELAELNLAASRNTNQEVNTEENPTVNPNPFASVIPLLTSLSGHVVHRTETEEKPSRYLVEKGLPTLPTKLVEKVWRLEFVDMEEFLPAPRSLRMAEQDKPVSLQESLVGAFSQFQAIQQRKGSVRSWT